MRRPLKPFVTEYKNPTRRPKDMFDLQASPGLSANESFADLGGESSRNFAPPEDGYEAAMRAADALFASPTRPPAPEAIDNTPSQPQPPERNGGRILEAIDETPTDPFAALAAERTPKRRGRKPGSKNKPKPSVAAPDDAVEVPIRAVARNTLANAGQSKKAGPKRAVSSTPEPRTAVAILADDRPAVAARSGERFAWVRTTLRPGERWKRRLPKVAW